LPESGRTALEALLSKLRRYPELRYRLIPGGVRIEAPNPGGFAITFQGEGTDWLVAFGEGGLHEHFERAEEALDFVAFGLSDRCRLRETRTCFLQKAAVEMRERDGWTLVHEVGAPRIAFRRRRSQVVLQNTLLKSPP